MPIRPEMRNRYPKNWRAIRVRILERAGNRCETCGVPQYAVGYWDSGDFIPNAGNLVCDASGWGEHPNGQSLTYTEAREFTDQYNCYGLGKRLTDEDGNRWVVVVLTIAHIDPTPENCDDSNLVAECQRCHNRRDAPMRAANARETKRKRKAASALTGLDGEL